MSRLDRTADVKLFQDKCKIKQLYLFQIQRDDLISAMANIQRAKIQRNSPSKGYVISKWVTQKKGRDFQQ